VCGGLLCEPNGTMCNSSAQCCSQNCLNGACQP
jgi:hypothetical protein